MLASGIFDHPLVVLAILAAGAIIQWLTHKRQAEEARRQSESEQAGTPRPPAEETALERKLRELLGEPAPPANPAPPVLRREQGEPPRDSSWEWESAAESQAPTRPYSEPASSADYRLAPPPIALQSSGTRMVLMAPREAGQNLEILKSRPSSGMLSHRSRRRGGSESHMWLWRNKKNARRAFVASLVFGPPKGLEP